ALFAPPALAADTTEIINTDFQDGSWQDAWEKSGEPELSVVDLDGSDVLRVQDRTQDFDGIKSKAGLFEDAEPGDELELSLQLRLSDGAEPVNARFVSDGYSDQGLNYDWIGDTEVSDSWTEITGTYQVPAGADAAQLKYFICTSAADTA